MDAPASNSLNVGTPPSAMDWSGLFFSLRGRINRKLFWIGILVLWAVIWGPLLLFGSMLPPNVPPASYGPILEATAGLIALLWLILLVVGDIPIGVKRLHDLDMSGWWILFKFLPIGNLLFFLMLGVFRGTSGPNRFGPDPLGRHNIPDAHFE
jgi:uncharacterized membrane protein YhaH (DUF805 family)